MLASMCTLQSRLLNADWLLAISARIALCSDGYKKPTGSLSRHFTPKFSLPEPLSWNLSLSLLRQIVETFFYDGVSSFGNGRH